MNIIYKFNRSSVGQSYTLRAGMGSGAAILIPAFEVDATRSISETISNPAELTELWFRNETTGEVYPYDIFDPAVHTSIDLIIARLTPTDQIPPGPVIIRPVPDGSGFVDLDVYTYNFVGVLVPNIPITLKYRDKRISFLSGFPSEYEETKRSDSNGKVTFRTVATSNIKFQTSQLSSHILVINGQQYPLNVPDEGGVAQELVNVR